jgi:hypothetical protein
VENGGALLTRNDHNCSQMSKIEKSLKLGNIASITREQKNGGNTDKNLE